MMIKERNKLNSIVEKAVPGWKGIVLSDDFTKWLEKQTQFTKDLIYSDHTDDAIHVLKKYQQEG